MRPKALVAFTGIILLLTAVDLVHINCPACEGVGYLDISKAHGMDNVRIVDVKSEIVEIIFCGRVMGYDFFVNASVVNEGTDVASGYLEVTYREHRFGKVIVKKPVPVHIAARTQRVILTRQFIPAGVEAAPTVPPRELFDISVSLPSSLNIVCPTCDGKGRISLFKWGYIALMK